MTRFIVAAVVALAAAATSSSAQTVTPDSLATLLPRAAFVFVGKIPTRSVPAVPGDTTETRRLLGVQVVDAFDGPRSMKLRAGERVQLLVDSGAVPKVATTAVVFATGWLAEDRLSLIEVARVSARTRAEWGRVRASYDSLRRELARGELQRAVAGADVAALGTVRAVTLLPDTRPPIARSEHDPVWERVSVLPLKVFKGDSAIAGQTMAVLVPTNRSHMWAHVPRPVVGDTSLFVLVDVSTASFYRQIDSTARFALADSVSVRPPVDTMLLRPRRVP